MKPPGMAATLAARLAQTDAGDLLSPRTGPGPVNDQREHADTTGIARQEKTAKFEEPGTLEDFDYAYSPERATVAAIRELTTMQLVQQGLPILLAGPVGTSKTRAANGIGRLAIRLGIDVRFARTSALLTYLAGGRSRGTWERRMASYTKPGLVILDNFAGRLYTGGGGEGEVVFQAGDRQQSQQAGRRAGQDQRAPGTLGEVLDGDQGTQPAGVDEGQTTQVQHDLLAASLGHHSGEMATQLHLGGQVQVSGDHHGHTAVTVVSAVPQRPHGALPWSGGPLNGHPPTRARTCCSPCSPPDRSLDVS